MNVWEVTFELHWDNMEPGEFDEEGEVSFAVLAPDYDGALEEARLLALAESWYDDEAGKDHFATDARLIEIKKGQSVDAIAKNLSQKV